MTAREIFLCVFVPVGMLFAALAIPMIRRKIPPNSGYGFRISKTLNNPSVWYDANEFSGRCLFALGVMTSLVSLVLYFITAIGDVAYSLICQTFMFLRIAASMFLNFRYVNIITKL